MRREKANERVCYPVWYPREGTLTSFSHRHARYWFLHREEIFVWILVCVGNNKKEQCRWKKVWFSILWYLILRACSLKWQCFKRNEIRSQEEVCKKCGAKRGEQIRHDLFVDCGGRIFVLVFNIIFNSVKNKLPILIESE